MLSPFAAARLAAFSDCFCFFRSALESLPAGGAAAAVDFFSSPLPYSGAIMHEDLGVEVNDKWRIHLTLG